MIPRRFRSVAAAACAVAAIALPARAAQDLEEKVRAQDARLAAEGFDAVRKACEERVAAERASAEARYLLGRVLGNEGQRLRGEGKEDAARRRVAEAKLQFEGALELDFTYAAAWRGMAKVHLFLGESETAVREARKAMELDASSREGKVLLAECLYQKGDRPAAYEVLAEEIAKDPKDSGLRMFLASLLFREQRFREAEAEVRVLLAQEPGDPGPRFLLIHLLTATGRGTEAREACRAAHAAIPGRPDFLFLLRELCVESKDVDGVIEADEALLLVPGLDASIKERLRAELEEMRAARDNPDAPVAAPTPEELVARLKSPDVAVRRAAADALAALPPSEIPSAVAPGITDADETVRLLSVRALARKGDFAAAGLFETLLFHPTGQDRSNAVRAAAARALGKLGSPAALPVLLRALDEEDADVFRAGIEGIAEITGFSIPDDPLAPVPADRRPAVRSAYRRWWEANPTARRWRLRAAEAVGRSGMRSLAMYLVPWVQHEDASVRAAALEAMAALTREDGWKAHATATVEERAALMSRMYERLGRPIPGDR